MSASLVGSEMCIRDRPVGPLGRHPHLTAQCGPRGRVLEDESPSPGRDTRSPCAEQRLSLIHI
eukprot:12202423-Alexandrium_andersonii.AAC.1